MLKGHLNAAAALSLSLAVTVVAPPARAAERSPLVGKSYCFENGAGTQRFTFTKQAGNKLLGSLAAYRSGSNEQVWHFPLLTAPKANGGVATLDGDQLNAVFYTPNGEPSGHDELTVDLAGDTIAGTATTYAESGRVTFSRC